MKVLSALLVSVSFTSIGSTDPYLEVCEDGQTVCFTHYYSGDSYTVAWSPVFHTQSFNDPVDSSLSPWSTFRSGQVTPFNDPTYGYVFRKTANNDPDGAQVQFAEPISDFQLTLFARKANEVGGNAMRYSVTDAAGSGYGFFVDSGTDDLTIEKRTEWMTGELVTSDPIDGGLKIGDWYTMRLTRHGGTLTAEVYEGRVNPDSKENQPLHRIEETDNTFDSFSHMGINGGHDYDTDEIKIKSLSNIAYDVRVIHDDGTVEDLGRTTEPQMTVQTDRTSNHVLHARAVDTQSGDVSAWGGLDNPATTWDGNAWVIVIKPRPPEPTFGDGQQ